MRATARILGSLAIGMLLLAAAGCEESVHELRMRIPDYDSSQVQGVTLWRLDEQTGEYVEANRVSFTRTLADGLEVVAYDLPLAADGDAAYLRLHAEVKRSSADPDQVDLNLFVLRKQPGEYRVSTFNDAGNSGLSNQGKVL